jgi:hypothetical protein
MAFTKYKIAAAMVACGLALGAGVREFGPAPAAAQDPASKTAARPVAPDIEPVDPNLVFDPEVQKQLRLSPNQIARLTEARDQGGAKAADQTRRTADLDRRIRELQSELERLNRERATAQAAVEKARTDGVKAALADVLSRDAVGQLRQITLQRMRLKDVLLDARVRARLDLNDEQVKKIQELSEKMSEQSASFTLAFRGLASEQLLGRVYTARPENSGVLLGLSEPDRGELMKVLSPRQVEALERLSGMKFDRK